MPLSKAVVNEWVEYPSIETMREYFMAKAGGLEYFHENSFLKYVESVKMFTEFLGHPDPEKALTSLNEDSEKAVKLLQEYVKWHRERGNSTATQRLRFTHVKRWGLVNDLNVNWGKVTIPKVRPVVNDRAPSKQELRKILAYAPTWLVSAVLTLVSSGIRIGGLVELKIKHLDLSPPDIGILEVPPSASKAEIGYFTCITPEAREALQKNRQNRLEAGEQVGPESPLIKSPRSKAISTYSSIQKAWIRTLRRAGLDSKSHTYHVLHLHSLRKFFRSQVEGILTKSIREAMMGHLTAEYLDKSYLRIPKNRLIQEYRKTIPALTIFEDVTSDEFQKRQLLRQASLLLPEEKLRMLQEILARTKNIDVAVNEFRKLREEPETNDTHKVVSSEEEMLGLLDEGWELVRELNGDRFLMKKA